MNWSNNSIGISYLRWSSWTPPCQALSLCTTTSMTPSPTWSKILLNMVGRNRCEIEVSCGLICLVSDVWNCSQGSQSVTKLAVGMEGMEGNWAACPCKSHAPPETNTFSGILSTQHKQQMPSSLTSATVEQPGTAFLSAAISWQRCRKILV